MVRRLIVIAFALALMLALRAVFGASAVGDRTALAAIGFVVLAAFTVGDMLKLVGLPRITGYILGGVVLGPYVSQVLTEPIVEDMTIFNNLALGLIALTAGLELEVKAIQKVGRTLMVTVLTKIPLLIVMVGGGLFAAHKAFGILELPTDAHAFVLSGVIAVLCIGTSPAIAIAVVSETGAKGRLSDLTLGIAVVKDVVVVVCLAIVIAIGGAQLTPGAKPVGDVLIALGKELGYSIGIGSVIGVLLILYVKYVGRELLLASVAVVLLVAQLSLTLHLELLLVFIAAGFVVRNFSHAEHELLPPLTRVSLPVFVVFFATAGAKIDLRNTLAVLPVAAGVVVVRAIAYYISARAGAAFGREAAAIRNNAWYGYIPQAGVTLGLVGLAVGKLTPLAPQIHQLGMAMVAIHLLLGPVLLGIALRQAGEIPSSSAAKGDAHTEARADARGAPADSEGKAQESADKRPAAEPSESEPAPRPAIDWPDEVPLREAAEQFQDRLTAWRKDLCERVIDPGVVRSRRGILHLITEHKKWGGVMESVRATLDSAPPDPIENLEADLLAACEEVRSIVEEGPDVIAVDMREALFATRPDDGLRRSLQRMGLRIKRGFGRRVRRRVPARVCARAASDATIAEALASVAATWTRTVGDMIRDVGEAVAGERDGDDTRRSLDKRGKELIELIENDLQRAVDSVMVAYVGHLSMADSPSQPLRSMRLSEIEASARPSLERLRAAARRRAHIRAWFGTLHADVIHAQCSARVDQVIDQHVEKPVGIVSDFLVERVREVTASMPSADIDPDTLDSDGLSKLLADIDATMSKRTHARLRGLQMKYYRATQASAVLADVAQALENVPEKLTFLDRSASDADDLSRDPSVVELDVARRLEEELSETFAPDIEEVMRPLGDLVAALDVRVQQAVTVASYGVGVARSSQEAKHARATAALDALERSRKLLDELVEELESTIASATENNAELLEQTRVRLDVALGRTGAQDARVGRRRRSFWQRRVERLRPWVAARLTRVVARIRALRRRPEVLEWMIRSGHERLDASGMRDYLARYSPPTSHLDIPPIYAKLFSGESVDDGRLATAHRELLNDLVTALTPGKREDFTSVLVIGERGSGRTTLINLITHRCARRRVVRIDPRYHGREGGVVAAIAEELGCLPEPGSVSAALRRAKTIVLVDDLERFLVPGLGALDDLEQFIQLVRESSAYAHWVVTAQRTMVEVFDTLLPLSGTFGRWASLKPLDDRQLASVIESRIRISGLEVVCAENPSRARWRRREEQRYFKALARQCHGNLRWAILTHARCTEQHGDELLATRARPAGLPFLERLGAGPLAVLSTIFAYGELTHEEIAEGMLMRVERVEAHVSTLVSAGLLCPAPGGAGMTIPVELVDAISHSLRELRVRGGGVR